NEDEADSVTLSGQVEVGSTVNSIVISDGNPANDVTVPAAAITVDAETGAVTVTGQDLSGLADGTLTVTMNVTDEAGNTGDVTDETILDTTAASQDDGLNSIVFDDDLVNEDEADSVTLSGQVEVGSTVNSIVISDGNPANDVTVPAAAITVDAETGAVTVTGQDLSGLADGTLTVTMNVTDEAGNTGDVTDETILDTTAASQDDGLNSIVFDDDLVNEDEADSVTLSGQVEVGSTVNSIVISDGNPANDVTVPAAAITVDAETGAVTVTGQDLSGLADGTLTVTMNVTDEAGNTGDVTDETILDTTAASQDDGLNSIVFDDDLVNEDEADSVTLSGQVEVGSTVNSIVISDGNPANDVTVPAAAITVDAETGAVTVTGQDLSGLADGTLTVTMNVTDEAGNTGDVTDETILDTTAASQDDGLNSIVFDDDLVNEDEADSVTLSGQVEVGSTVNSRSDDDLVNEDEADSVTLSGQVEVGSTVNSIVISDGNPANDVTVPAAAITVDAETGAVTVTGQDLSGLADGTLTVTMNVTDEAGNTGDVTDETILDTTAASQDDGLNSIVFDDDLVNEDEADSVTLSGQVEVGSTVNSIVISDGNPANDVTVPAAAITVDAETGAVTVTGQDLSGLADGTLTVTMNVTDEGATRVYREKS
ncbi:beta strand repeat-containing protein, partial [Vibrio cyclitrophicus]